MWQEAVPYLNQTNSKNLNTHQTLKRQICTNYKMNQLKKKIPVKIMIANKSAMTLLCRNWIKNKN
jgi:hypothetical protein